MSGGWWIEINGGMRGGSVLIEYRKRVFAARESLKTFQWAGKSDCLQVRLDRSRFEGITGWISMRIDRVGHF
jgi:CRISPR/Cas system endoribonuclease Cas6 (RAMP superfamily)